MLAAFLISHALHFVLNSIVVIAAIVCVHVHICMIYVYVEVRGQLCEVFPLHLYSTAV